MMSTSPPQYATHTEQLLCVCFSVPIQLTLCNCVRRECRRGAAVSDQLILGWKPVYITIIILLDLQNNIVLLISIIIPC